MFGVERKTNIYQQPLSAMCGLSSIDPDSGRLGGHMLYSFVPHESDRPLCRLLLYLRCYLALRDISSYKQEVAEHVIRHPNVMRQNCRPKTKLGLSIDYAARVQILDGFRRIFKLS